MNINAAFPSTYLKAADLQGRAVPVVIADCRLEHLDDGDKPLLMFQGKDRGLILNKTNGGILSALFGDETDHWKGQTVELYPDKVMFQGRVVDAIRIRQPRNAPAAAPAPAPAPQAPAPAPATANEANMKMQAPPPADVAFDDDIPF